MFAINWILSQVFLSTRTLGQRVLRREIKIKERIRMCGIAGLIHKGKQSNVGNEMTAMLQALKHRGPDSTGYAMYRDRTNL